MEKGRIMDFQTIDGLVHPQTQAAAWKTAPTQNRWGLFIPEFTSLGADGMEEEFVRTGGGVNALKNKIERRTLGVKVPPTQKAHLWGACCSVRP